MSEPPEPTREQLAKIDELAGIYDSVEVRPYWREGAQLVYPPPIEFTGNFGITCWRYRESGAKIVAHALTIHPDGTESDRR